MKTRIANQEVNRNVGIFILVVIMMFYSKGAYSQEDDSTEALFRSNVIVSELWTPEVKINSIQGDIGTLVGFYGGALFNHTFLLGISGGVNLGHPRINYGYFGIIGQYIYRPEKLVHCSVQWLLAHGSTKDYENPKSGLFDNFWNISGAGFYLMEPGFNLEINLSRSIVFVAGVSYRYVTGLNENNENVSITHVTNKDLSGLNFNIGIKFAKERKTKK
ncbi:MAG: hypothetical protein Q8868_13255 [Bacteroidota bacterium]|nr:hypothetical protein [Bacteroidota bacterium]